MRLHHFIYLLVCLSLSVDAHCSGGQSAYTGSETLRVLDSISGKSTVELVREGERLFQEAEYDSALNVFTVVCRRYDNSSSVPMQKEFAKAFNRYGNILYKRGAYSLAMDSYLQMRRIAEDHALGDVLAVAFVRIGNIYAASGDYGSAVDFYRRALDVPEIRNNEENAYQMALNNLFASSLFAGDLLEARKYLERYKDVFEDEADEPFHVYDVTLAEGLIAQESGNQRQALSHYRKALDCVEANRLDPLSEGSVYSCMGEAYKKIGDSDSALFCLRKARDIACTAGNGRLIVESLRDMADFFEECHLPDSANAYRAMYFSLADSISYQEEVNKFKSSQMLYELDKSEYTIRTLNVEKKNQATVILVIAIAAAVCIVLVFILLRQNRKLKAAWEDLYERSSRQLSGELGLSQNLVDDDALVGKNEEEDLPGATDSRLVAEERERKLLTDAEEREKIAAAVVGYMDSSDGFCASDFSLEKLAAEIGYNPRYVSEVINVVFQKNFRALLNEYRVRKAMLWLQDTENYGKYTIKAISENVGYKSPATFISVFTKATGLKPGIYQKLAKEKNSR